MIRNQPRSSRRRFVGLSSLVCDRESQPNNERKRFLLRPDPCKTSVDSASIFSFQERTCPVFLFFLLYVVSLFYTLPQASSPLSTGLSWSRGAPSVLTVRIYAPASPLWGPNIHWQPKQQIKLRVFIASLIPRQQVVVPVSAHSAS